jgi:Capsular polysaccharide synthesis protein
MKTIWTCWLQGRQSAPPLVKQCLKSWERNNPGWEIRCLDAKSVGRYVSLPSCIDLRRQTMTAASLSDILRIALLHEFGGVWADATLFCNRPLDQWLGDVMQQGFFAFAAPTPDRPLSSWFLSAKAGSHVLSAWYRRIIDYWSSRTDTDDYFWLHHLFQETCAADAEAARVWSEVPKISADGPHALQLDERIYRPAIEVADLIDWTTPVFKLTHRLPERPLEPGCLLESLLAHDDEEPEAAERAEEPPLNAIPPPRRFAALKVCTENLGDYIQINSGLRLLSRLGVKPERYIDRDHEIKTGPKLQAEEAPLGILLNGWFKENCAEWPPHPKLAPLIFGFHLQPVRCPGLLSEASLDFLRLHQPIGCRDVYTASMLRSKGVEAFTSNCLSLLLPRRIDDPATQIEIFVVSRDERITSYICRGGSSLIRSSLITPVRMISWPTRNARSSCSNCTVRARN